MSYAKIRAISVLQSPRIPTLVVKKPAILNSSILESQLQRCSCRKQFLQIHSQVVVSGLADDTYAASRLLKFATESGYIHLDYARRLLDQIQHPSPFVWNTLMRSYVRQSAPQDSIFLYKLMLEKKVDDMADNYTYPILAQACAARCSEREGRQIHDHVWKLGFDSDVYVVNTLINMYAVCGHLSDARQLFDTSAALDSVSWNSILAGYVQVGDVEEAFSIFDRMPERNAVVSSSMITLLGKAGRVSDACLVFDGMCDRNVVSWSAMISCYVQNGMFEDALQTFSEMNSYQGIVMDEVVMVSVLSACANLLSMKEGVQIHGLIVKLGFESYVNLHNALIHLYSSCGDITAAQKLFQQGQYLDQISWNSMISGYLKCSLLEDAKRLFDSMTEKDVVSWSTIISGYAQHDRFSETLDLFQHMQVEGIEPDETTLVSVLSACTRLSALEQGKWVHAYIRKNGIKINVILGTTIVDMYMKCGCVGTALEVFLDMHEKGVSTWNAVIVGLAMNGRVDVCLEKFAEMVECGIMPNEITFVSVLSACRYGGLVDEGRGYFALMIDSYDIKPNVKHYGCLVDLLGRAGLLKEAEELIENMPMRPDVATWGALLGACRKFGDTEMGERVGRRLIELEPLHDGFHVLLSNMYASQGRWNEVMEVRGMMEHNRVAKTPGCSLIEADGVVHEFFAGDRSHPSTEKIDEMLDEIYRRLKMDGYRPDTNEVALDIDEEEKESTLYRHSEKLAIAFGLISIKSPTPIRIMKNLRICRDCHNAAKFISRAFEREIVLRDRHLFHHFKDGECSCADYW